MGYYITAFTTALSAFLGLCFSIHAVIRGKNQEKTNALYMFARSVALVGISILPFIYQSERLLLIATGAMLIIQMIDGIAGIYIKNRMRTIGPFTMAFIHAACLLIFF